MSTDGRNRRRAQMGAAYADALLPGETLIVNYCDDVSGCDCPSTHNSDPGGVPCKPIATTAKCNSIGFPPDAVHRCVRCGTRWKARAGRWEPLVLLDEPRSAA